MTTPRVETVRFNGVTFRRYPHSPHLTHRQYFTPGIADRARGIDLLHREIWKHAHGPIPDGHEIHHIDLNPLNNDLANLECLTIADHKEAHREQARVRATTPAALAHLDRIRPLAVDWHSSPAGHAWHSDHSREVMAGLLRAYARTELCQHCSNPYQTNAIQPNTRFCSNACKSAARRASGVDNETRTCARASCSAPFTANRYQPIRYCGRSCAARDRAGSTR